MLRRTGLIALSLVAVTAAAVHANERLAAKPSVILSEQEATRQDNDWGTLFTYDEGENYSAKDGLAAVAVIKPGMQIHPPHQHAEEEYVIITEGTGVWSMNGKERPARAGDMQYAAPWDMHGLRNTGSTPLRFFVWKWNGKGVAPMAKPQ